MGSLTQEITYMEQQTWEALKKSGQALIPYVSSDAVMVFPGGVIFTETSDPPVRDILNTPNLKPWLNYEMRQVKVLELGHDAASISYEVEASREDADYHALITSIWQRDGNSWKMRLHQQTLV